TVQSLEPALTSANTQQPFQVTGTQNPVLKAQAQLRFLAFTNQFVIQEYEPASIEASMMADEVREAVLRGAEVPDDFSTRPAQELQTLLHDTPTLALAPFLNHA